MHLARGILEVEAGLCLSARARAPAPVMVRLDLKGPSAPAAGVARAGQLYGASASEDIWADPKGEYIALQAATPAWAGIELPLLGSVFCAKCGSSELAVGLGI
jgi:hypothetical protein